jgi:N-acetylglucosaminyldiphosphoundecaprenol N-acetyl-beta-D-mannosaminyltransferase
LKTIEICNLPITVFDNDDNITDLLTDILSKNKLVSFHGYSLDTLYLIKQIPNLFTMRLANDYFLCDGRGFYYLMKILGARGVSKLSLPSLTLQLLTIAGQLNKSVYILGATRESNNKAIQAIKGKYRIKYIWGRNGYFNEEEEESIVQEINYYSPDILLLGMSSPKKDEYVYRWKTRLKVKIIVHCGGMIDIISGKTKMYPQWVKNFCLAGIYRFLQEPVRLKRDFFNIFPSLFIATKIIIMQKVLHRNYIYSVYDKKDVQ